MRYLVTGGSGFLGINLIRFLLEKDQQVVSLDLLPFDYADCRDKVEAIVGDIRDRAAVDRAMRGVQIVVHCAAALPLYSRADIISTDIDGTRNVLEAALQAKVERVIHVSSTAVYGARSSPAVRDRPARRGGPYGEAEIAAEQLCVDYRKKGLCIPILRPKSFVGRSVRRVRAALRLGARRAALPAPWQRRQSLPVDGRRGPLRRHLPHSDSRPRQGQRRLQRRREGVQHRQERLPGSPRPGGEGTPDHSDARVAEHGGSFNASRPRLSPVYKWAYGTVSKESFVSIEKAEKVLGFAPRYSNKAALIRNYDWYLANLHRFQGQAGVTHRVPWSQGILSIAKRFF
jgi:nucleoside-diphosphate-sugar epimerase